MSTVFAAKIASAYERGAPSRGTVGLPIFTSFSLCKQQVVAFFIVNFHHYNFDINASQYISVSRNSDVHRLPSVFFCSARFSFNSIERDTLLPILPLIDGNMHLSTKTFVINIKRVLIRIQVEFSANMERNGKRVYLYYF